MSPIILQCGDVSAYDRYWLHALDLQNKHTTYLVRKEQKAIRVNDEWMSVIYGNMKTSLPKEMKSPI